MAISFVGSLPTVGANNGGNVTLTFSNLVTSGGGAASLQQGDVVVCAYASSGIADAAMSTSSSNWNEVHENYSNGSANDTNLALYWKVMGASPDTSFVAVGPTGNSNGTIGVAMAFRGVDAAVLDIAFVAGSHSATGTATTRPDPPAITPSTAGAWPVVVGAGAAAAGAVYTNPGDLSSTTNHFRSGNHAETIDIAIGMGFKTDWTSGAFNPSQFSGGATNAGDSWAAMVIALKPAPENQELTPALFTNNQTFHAPTVTPGLVGLTPSLFTDSQTFFAPTVTPGAVGLTPSLVSNEQTFHAATVAQVTSLTPSLVTNSQEFFAPTVAVGAVELTPGLFTDGQTFHAPTISSVYGLTPSLLTNTSSFFALIVAPGAVALTPPLVSNDQTFFAPTVSAGSVALTPALFTNTQDFRSATISVGAVTLTAALFTNSAEFFAPTVGQEGGPQQLTVPLLPNTQSFPASVVSTSYAVTVPLVTNTETFIAPTVSPTNTIVPALVTNDNEFFSATITTGGDAVLAPPLTANDNLFFAPTVGLYTNTPEARTSTAERAVRDFIVAEIGSTSSPSLPRTTYAAKRTA